MRKVFMTLICAVLLAVFLSLSGTASGATLYVGPGETYTEIQPAINAAINGDTIIVRDGTYTGANNKNLDFGGKTITLKSENGPQYCVIDCQGSGRGFYFHSGETSESIVDGFTIKNGSWPYVRWYEGGGGIYCYYSSPTIRNCIIIGNTCNGAWGGAIANERSSPQIINCIISANAGGWGGGISNAFSSPQIINCTISVNYASAHGGGILSYSSATATKNCVIIGNVTAGFGGGINDQYCSGPITNCTFSGNSAVWGGGIYVSNCSPSITNSIFWEDYASKFGPEVFSWSGSHPTIQYSDIRGGQSGVYQTPDALINWGEWKPWPGNGNINADPVFVGGGDYHLTEFSPCVDVGTDAGLYTDIDGDTRPYDVPNWGKDGTGDEFDMGADEFAPPCYDFYGFIEPLPFEDSSEVRTYKSNRIIPVKFRLYDSFGEEITSLSEPPVISVLYAGSSNPGGDPTEYDVTGQADDGDTFRYSDENWIFNLSMRSFMVDSSYDIIVIVPETGCSYQVRIHLVK
ncbi:MAG: hypothetical protein JSV96_10775 [Candidatus Aminicenantes bacterium]|nr:MAG: hypothetical protein JSV96_10775 [Candidatus Aminicenantes bacterium]